MSSCLSGGGRAYRLESLDVEITKSPSTNSWLSSSSSPSSTLSESSHCNPLAISTWRKPRTPRKRPNQTYNEAAALLSTAYPKIFPAKNLKSFKPPLLFEPSDLIMPLNYASRLIQRQNQIQNQNSAIGFNPICHSPGEINSFRTHGEEYEEGDVGADFDAESMLDEELGEGIDSIMGNCGGGDEKTDDIGFCYGYPVGIGFKFGYGLRRETRAMRGGDECDWWRFPSVEVRHDIMAKTTIEKKNNNDNNNKGFELIKNLGVGEGLSANLAVKEGNEECTTQQNVEGLHLKLNYDVVLDAWSHNGSPFSGDSPAGQSAGNDLQTRLAQIDLFLDNGGIREASVQRYKEKRRNRLFSKKIRYQVRKVNADRRPRMKGRFVRTPNSSHD